MQKTPKIPVLTDLIEKGVEIELSDLGLDPDPEIDQTEVLTSLRADPALEQEIRRILDEHMELAWQEIRIVIQQAGVKSST